MAIVGMNVEEVRRLAGALRAQRDELSGVITTVDSALLAAPSWRGEDRVDFESKWTEDKALLAIMVNQLDDDQLWADAEASDQEEASAVGS
jgi:hypothetical protein